MSAIGQLRLYLSTTHGHGDLVGDVLDLPFSWIVVRDNLNRLDFKATPTLRVCPSDPCKYLGHVIRQVELDRTFFPVHRK